MKKIKLFKMPALHKPGVGFYLLLAVFVHFFVASILYAKTFEAFHYDADRWIIAMTVIGFWAIFTLLVNGLFSGNRVFLADVMYLVAVFALTLTLIKFLIPCLSPIGIYFTVHNMGDVEANAIGVPRCIAGLVFYLTAVIALIVSAFFHLMKESKEAATEQEEPQTGVEE